MTILFWWRRTPTTAEKNSTRPVLATHFLATNPRKNSEYDQSKKFASQWQYTFGGGGHPPRRKRTQPDPSLRRIFWQKALENQQLRPIQKIGSNLSAPLGKTYAMIMEQKSDCFENFLIWTFFIFLKLSSKKFASQWQYTFGGWGHPPWRKRTQPDPSLRRIFLGKALEKQQLRPIQKIGSNLCSPLGELKLWI